MLLYLIRHAIAETRNKSGDDSQRKLTPEGREKMRLAASGLSRLIPSSARLLTSPTCRTKETAELVAKACRLARTPLVAESLAPATPLKALVRLISRSKSVRHLVLIGHEPNLSSLARYLLLPSKSSASIRPIVDFKKGGLCVLKVENKAAGLSKAQLLLHLTPKILTVMSHGIPTPSP